MEVSVDNETNLLQKPSRLSADSLDFLLCIFIPSYFLSVMDRMPTKILDQRLVHVNKYEDGVGCVCKK